MKLTSKRSDSKSKPTRLRSLKRTRALKRRNVEFRPIDREHFGYAWAAYKRGAFGGQHTFEENLTPMEFSSILTQKVQQFLTGGGEVVVVIGNTDGEGIPIGIISIAYQENRAYPHIIWFPEATPRLRLEVGVKFLVELKQRFLVLVTAVLKDQGYFRHLCRYGLLRSVGKISGYTADDQDAMMFQTVGK